MGSKTVKHYVTATRYVESGIVHEIGSKIRCDLREFRLPDSALAKLLCLVKEAKP